MSQLRRAVEKIIATIASGAAKSSAVVMDEMAGGLFVTPASLAATTVIAFEISTDGGTTWVPLYDADNALVTVTVALDASRAYPLPDELFAAPMFRFWTQASGTGVNQTEAETLQVFLKG